MELAFAAGFIVLLITILYLGVRLILDLAMAAIWFCIAVIGTLTSPLRRRRRH